MEIKKGKFYYNKESNELIIADRYMFVVDNLFTDKIAVHTPTQDDRDFVVRKLGVAYYNMLATHGKDTCICLNDGKFIPKNWYKENNYHLITMNQFKELFKYEDTKHEKVYIRGHKTRGAEVIAKLESLGGVNYCRYNGRSINCLYFIEVSGEIGIDFERPNGYTEIFLDEPDTEKPPLTREQVELKVVEYAKSVNWDFEKIASILHNDSFSKSEEYELLDGGSTYGKVQNIFSKYYDNSPLMQGVKHLPKT